MRLGKVIAPVVIAGGVIIFLLVANPWAESPRPMGLGFVGFTNNADQTEALFWFTNRASPDFTFSVLETRRKEGNEWVLEPTRTTGSASVYMRTSSSGTLINGIGDLDLIGVGVPTTNVPVRVVLQCNEPETPGRSRQLWLRERWQSIVSGKNVSYSRTRTSEVVGETEVR